MASLDIIELYKVFILKTILIFFYNSVSGDADH